MHPDAGRMSNVAKLPDLAPPVDRPGFGGLRQRERARLNGLDEPTRKPVERLAQLVRRDLAAPAGDADQLRPPTEEFGRAAFVVVNMRLLVAEYGAPWLSQ